MGLSTLGTISISASGTKINCSISFPSGNAYNVYKWALYQTDIQTGSIATLSTSSRSVSFTGKPGKSYYVQCAYTYTTSSISYAQEVYETGEVDSVPSTLFKSVHLDTVTGQYSGTGGSFSGTPEEMFSAGYHYQASGRYAWYYGIVRGQYAYTLYHSYAVSGEPIEHDDFSKSDTIEIKDIPVYIKQSDGAWHYATPYIKYNGVWHYATPYIMYNGAWHNLG